MRKLGLRARLAVVLAAMLVFGAAGVVPLLLHDIRETIERAEERELLGYRNAFQAALDMGTASGQALALMAANTPAARAAFAAGDRDRLAAMFVEPFGVLKRELGVEQMQFHLPPATSFLRAHMPTKFGDDLSSFRQTVVEANRDRRPVMGLENGVGGMGIRAVVPMADGGRHLGTVEFGMNFGQALADSIRKRFGVEVAIHAAKGAVGQGNGGAITPVAATVADSFFTDADRRAALAGESIVRRGELKARPVAALAAPVPDYRGQPAAVVEIMMDSSDYAAQYAAARNRALLVAAGVLAVGVVVALLLAARLSRSLMGLTAAMRALAGGTTEVAIPGTAANDEIGEMARAVRVFKTNAIEKARLESERMAQEAMKARRQETMERLTREFQGDVGKTLSEVEKAATELRDVARTMEAVADETREQAGVVVAAATQASANVQTVAEAAGQLAASEREISGSVQKSSDIARAAATDAEGISGIVGGLGEAASRIGDVVALIDEIAGQTNLLALNATIEAARAGEAGKGFAVVAGEVKNLAHQTARATGDITAQIGAVQKAAGEAARVIGAIGHTIAEINAASTTVAAAVEQQSAATSDIAENVNEASRGTREVKDSIARVSDAAVRTGAAVAQVMATADLLIARSTGLATEVNDFLNDIGRAGDRRRHPRFDVTLPASVAVAEGGRREATVVNLSLGGAMLDRDVGGRGGDPVALEVATLPAVRGRLIGVTDGRSRLQFTADPAAERALSARLAGAALAPAGGVAYTPGVRPSSGERS